MPASGSTSTSTATTGESSSPSTSETTEGTIAPDEELPESLREEISRLVPITEEIRGLQFHSPPDVTVLTPAELEARVVDQLLEDFVDYEVDEALYRLLGLVPADFDLLDAVLPLFGESVRGLYDNETKELVVTATEDAFSPYEEVTIVHEMTHALTDQVLDFGSLLRRLFDEERYDEMAAFQGLLEGDATLAGLMYVQQLDVASQQDYLERLFAADTSALDQIPEFMVGSLSFPYDTGLTFVQDLFSEGGFGAVDDAYATPPVSTEQVIWPDDYLVDLPDEVILPDNELSGYEISETSTWGELGFRLMFDQVLGGADSAAEGWGGDSYRIYSDGSNVVLALLFQGDEAGDAAELARALNEYVTVGMNLTDPVVAGDSQSYLGDRYALVSLIGDQVLFVAASDPAVGPTVRGWFPGF